MRIGTYNQRQYSYRVHQRDAQIAFTGSSLKWLLLSPEIMHTPEYRL